MCSPSLYLVRLRSFRYALAAGALIASIVTSNNTQLAVRIMLANGVMCVYAVRLRGDLTAITAISNDAPSCCYVCIGAAFFVFIVYKHTSVLGVITDVCQVNQKQKIYALFKNHGAYASALER